MTNLPIVSFRDLAERLQGECDQLNAALGAVLEDLPNLKLVRVGEKIPGTHLDAIVFGSPGEVEAVIRLRQQRDHLLQVVNSCELARWRMAQRIGGLEGELVEAREIAGQYIAANKEVTTLWQAAEARIADLEITHDRRVTELLEANNREVERRRKAETAVGRFAEVEERAAFIADCLRKYADLLQSGAVDGAGHYFPADILAAANEADAIAQSEP